jgi:dipeptidyl-peptidase-4
MTRRNILNLICVGGCVLVPQVLNSAGAQETGKRITWDHVYGRKKVVIRDPAPRGFKWLDDRTLLRQEFSWEKLDADTGDTQPYYDAKQLKRRLIAAGIPNDNAGTVADGDWTLHDPNCQTCVLHSKNQLIRCRIDGSDVKTVDGLPEDVELLTLSPTGNACAFVSADDLWCADFDNGLVRQLTHHESPRVRCGKADWIYYEEVYRRRWKAFHFSPDGEQLLFQQFDDTAVSQFSVIDHSRPLQKIETESFPQAGQQNPEVQLGIVAVDGGPVRWVASPYPDPATLITRFGWYPDSQHIYWFAQNRQQTWLDMLRADRDSGASQVLFRETTGAWVMPPDAPVFLDDGSFLFVSERSGWKHVDRISADGQSRQAITSGNWDVSQIHAVNESEGWMIVTGTRDSSIADNVYRVSFTDGTLQRLADETGHHTVVASPSGVRLVDSWSTHRSQVSVSIRDETGQVHREVHEATEPNEFAEFAIGEVSIRDIPLAENEIGKAILVLPPGFDRFRVHPVWLKVYGGPRYARVRDSWNARLDDHLLASHGIVVLHVEPRTAGGFGASGAWKAYKQLGVEETRDIEAVCDWIKQQPWADGERIGMSGHSYGGFLTSYVMTHSQCITAGVAGSPVTDWANYDTIYTERYMGTPDDNAKGYRKSSVVAAAAKLHGRLLLVHGLRDDNVHPANTFQFVRALQQANKHFELMVYPRAKHAIHEQHYNKLRHEFVLKSLGIE